MKSATYITLVSNSGGHRKVPVSFNVRHHRIQFQRGPGYGTEVKASKRLANPTTKSRATAARKLKESMNESGRDGLFCGHQISALQLQFKFTHCLRSSAVEALKAELSCAFTRTSQTAYRSSGIHLRIFSSRRWFTGNMGSFLAPQKVLPNWALNRTYCGGPAFGLQKPSPNTSPPQ